MHRHHLSRYAALAILWVSPCICAAAKDLPPVQFNDVAVTGAIEGKNITFTIDIKATTKSRWQSIKLISGDIVLQRSAGLTRGDKIEYDQTDQAYWIKWKDRGEHRVQLVVAARPKPDSTGKWREAVLAIPSSQVRRLSVTCDRRDLQVQFPGALRVTRSVEEDELVMTALLGAGKPFIVRWQPQVETMEAKLVTTGRVNTIATVAAGVLRLDQLFAFDIAQGQLTILDFDVPAQVSITQVTGENIRDWQMTDHPQGRRLSVTLNRAQTLRYMLVIRSESVMGALPAEIDVPVIAPAGGLRADGQLAIGTDSAIQLVVLQTSALSQIDGAAFERMVLDDTHGRAVPGGKAFFYTFASSRYQLKLAVQDIVPSYDAVYRLLLNVREDDLTLEGQVELDVRDAPIRTLQINVPAGLVVAQVEGEQIEDYSVVDEPGEMRRVVVRFREPVIGRVLLGVRLELGRGPLEAKQSVNSLSVRDAKNQRGYLVVSSDPGIRIDSSSFEGLRKVHAASVPFRVANARLAYRFRDPTWQIELTASRKEAGIRVEAFHILSLGEGICHGAVAMSYFINDSPVDQLHFIVAKGLDNIEFVGRDVRRWAQDPQKPDHWVVTLRRKVIGDYNLAVSYTQRYDPGAEAGAEILIGGVQCDRVSTQTGHIIAASHLDLNLQPINNASSALIAIDPEEVPAGYRLLVNAPIRKTYKYVSAPHDLSIKVQSYDRTDLLPAVIDLIDAKTSLTVLAKSDTAAGKAESVTRIRYKVKNVTSQFLAFKMPAGAKLWATRQIFGDANGHETSRRVATSFDQKSSQLLVPLPRQHNPNDPITIEVEFGQVHQTLPVDGQLALVSPISDIRSTFATWTVTAPQDMALLPTGDSTMAPEYRPTAKGDLGVIMQHVIAAWRHVFQYRLGWAWSAVAGMAMAWALFILIRGTTERLRLGASIFMLSVLICLGIAAAMSAAFKTGIMGKDLIQSAVFTQAIHLEPNAPMTLHVTVMPTWRAYTTLTGSVVFPGIAVICLLVAMKWRRGCMMLRGAAASLLIYAAAQFPPLTAGLGHLLTWGLPAIGLIFCLARSKHHLPNNASIARPATATAIIALLVTLISAPPAHAGVSPSIAQLVECDLTVERDSMMVDLSIQAHLTQKMQLNLFDDSNILMSPAEIGRYVHVKQVKGQHVLVIDRKGEYNIKLRFLRPLPPPDAQQRHLVTLPLPLGASNRHFPYDLRPATPPGI